MSSHAAEVLVPITMFLILGVVVIGVLYFRMRNRQLLSDEIKLAIEKGVDVPFPEPKKNRLLLPGIIWTLVGVVSTIGMYVTIPMDAPAGTWVWGLLPVAIGVGFLIVHFIEKKEKEEEDKKAF
ncbi:MAG: DUF6249 domain-containing protein [Candidatus Marinimicrobia bacterium]|nr:DUF6249 domain-containing protein [Candidatus Neomarinimicrobiota bacterium]MCF7904081.1 DUF6249 domain-containing protein [Candidatus Neomarinimicrobiota bacterium]